MKEGVPMYRGWFLVSLVAAVSIAANLVSVEDSRFGWRNGGTGPPFACADHDSDGICNGQDTDYVPGIGCTNPYCPIPDCPNPDCSNDDGVCNGQAPNYQRP